MKAMVAVLPGDGIGTEVVPCAVEVLGIVASLGGHDLSFHRALIGGRAIDQTGSPLPDAALGLCRDADAVLFGAAGGPAWDGTRPGVRPEQGKLAARRPALS